MRFQKLNVITDILALIAFIISASSGITLVHVFRKIIPTTDMLLGMSINAWRTIHDYSSIILIILIIVHILFHIGWIKEIPDILKAKIQGQNGNKKRTSV